MAAPDVGTSQNSQISHISFLETNVDNGIGESQESCTQHEMTQMTAQGELTQLGFDDDESNLGCCHSPFSPVDPLTIPWGRLIPQNNSGATEMTPRAPAGSITRSKSPHNHGRSPSPASFMGLRNLAPGDRFNEYILGRSAKVDVTATKIVDRTNKQAIHDYAHSSISNRHCRIFCILGSTEMEVFVEDTSGNGTLVNNTTLLHKNERRKLHTGDVISLVNPAFLSKRIKNPADRKFCVDQYSFVFVNLWEQEVRGISPKSGGSRGAVNARAVKMHSAQPGRSRFRPMDQQHQPTAHVKNSSLGSFLNDAQKSGEKRIEEEYDIREKLGTGTCGEVRRAIHRQTGDERAVKIIQIGDRRGGTTAGHFSEEKLKLIKAEADILRSLDHPYVVKLFEVFVSPGKYIYLVMELLHGGDLYDRIVQKDKYSEVQARRIMRRILAAVYHLHEERGIVHRDLKPENIMMINRTSDISIKLTDFGVAKNLTAEGLKTFCGTPQYFAPEVFKRCNTVKGEGRYGKEIDCWSLGIILFILLTGYPPFEVDSSFDAVATAEIIFHEDQWGEISSEAKDLVEKLLKKNPAERMSVQQACEHGWVLKDDGDTHCHPLADPLISNADTNKSSECTTRNSKEEEEEEEDTANLNEEVLMKSDSESASLLSGVSSSAQLDSSKNCMLPKTLEQTNFNSSGQGTDLSSNECSHTKSKTAASSQPLESKTPNQARSSNQKENIQNLKQDNRHNSILPFDNGISVTNAISQAMVVSLKSPNHGSPIHRKKLFDKDAAMPIPDTVRKVSKVNVECIKSAGETLPKPVLQSVPQGKPKKTEKQINSYFAPAATQKNNAESKSSQHKPSNPVESEKKRKAESSTITPPAGEQLVFSLNKRVKVDVKKRNSDIMPQGREDGPSTSKAELSEDELQSDFSDADDIDELEDMRNSTVDHQNSESRQSSLTEQLAKNKVTNITFKSTSAKSEHKKIQSYLFGKPPLDTKVTQNDEAVDNMEESNEPRAITSHTKVNEANELNTCFSPEAKSTTAKGNQKSIKSWFLPKTKK